MIDIREKKQCCGCTACVNICPKQCIEMQEDEEGFLYPSVNQDICIDCGLCEKICPELNQKQAKKPIAIYAAKHQNDEIRLSSSSGGIFFALTEKVIKEKKGVVFGCKYDEDWNVVHSFSETLEGCKAFRTSKYVQSNMGNCFKQVKDFLLKGRFVMFTGTPCQIAGLKGFLRKEYDNLLTVEIVCHGVPSPGVWRKYIEDVKNSTLLATPSDFKSKPIITNINFREKQSNEYNWLEYGFVIHGKANLETNKKTTLISTIYYKAPFMKGFLADLYQRPSCYKCPAKALKSGSDLSIADYWWIHQVRPDFMDTKGISLVYVASEFGKKFFESCNIKYIHTDSAEDIEKGYLFQGAAFHSAKEPKNRKRFFEQWREKDLCLLIDELTKPTLKKKVYGLLRDIKRNSSFITHFYLKYIKNI